MKIQVIKKFVIDALRAEVRPTPGVWLQGGIEPIGPIRNDPSCERCAVGAVVLGVLEDRVQRYDAGAMAASAARDTCGFPGGAGYRGTAIEMIKTDGPFAALSFFFESTTYRGKRRVDETVRFVEKHFPETVVLDLGEVRPGEVSRRFKRVR